MAVILATFVIVKTLTGFVMGIASSHVDLVRTPVLDECPSPENRAVVVLDNGKSLCVPETPEAMMEKLK